MDLTLARILQFLHSLPFSAKSSFGAYSKPVMAVTYILFSTHSVFFCDWLFCLEFMVIMNLLWVKRSGKYHSDYVHNRFTPFPDSVCFSSSLPRDSYILHQNLYGVINILVTHILILSPLFLTLSHLRPSFSSGLPFLVLLFGYATRLRYQWRLGMAFTCMVPER